jgi:hypothetical protein
MSGIGYSIAYINGRRVGTHELSPTWTRYEKMVQYVTHDITHLLHDSAQEQMLKGGSAAVCNHVIDVMLGSGHFSSNWYGGSLSAMLLAQINAQSFPSSGTSAMVSLVAAATRAGAWSFTGDGPILSSSLYGGETVNATASFYEDRWSWTPAACAPPLPQHPSEPNRISLQPPLQSASASSSTTQSSPNHSSLHPLFDFDANCSLTVQLNGSSLVPQRQVSSACSFFEHF